MKLRALSHCGITVSNFEKTVKWYNEMFGIWLIDEQVLPLEQVNRLSNLYGTKDAKVKLGFLRIPRGGVLEIFEFNPKGAAEKVIWNKPGITHVTFDVKNVQRWYRKLSDRGVEFFSEPQRTGKNEWVFLKDLDGNLIELIDLKANFFIIRWLGGLAGKVMAKRKFKRYY